MSFLDIFKRPATPEQAILAKDKIAELLSVDPDALARFEASYQASVLSQMPDDMFQINSRQASEMARAIRPNAHNTTAVDAEVIKSMTDRIVDELLAKTSVYVFDGDLTAHVEHPVPALPDGTPVTNEEILALPERLRPQLTGNLMRADVPGSTADAVLFHYARYLDESNPTLVRQEAYHQFRQGLDILDLDALTYEIIDTNRTSMGHWLPQLVDACRGKEFFKIPATRIAKVPLTLLQLAHTDYQELTRTTLDVVDRWAYKTFKLKPDGDYFIKTGTYSSKFDFRNARVHDSKEIRELGEYLLFIHFQALQMASPLCTPCVYGASTTTEWVVREFIQDKENNPTIYKGLPLHTEYRVFVDCDENVVIGHTPYWEPETMKKRFSQEADADSPHQIHDYIIYKSHEHVLMNRYNNNISDVIREIERILPDLDLTGQWSIDVMQNGEDFWLIDMAPAEESAFYTQCVMAPLRRPSQHDWLPKLPGVAAGE